MDTLSTILRQVGTAAGAAGSFALTVADSLERLEQHAKQQQQVLQVLGSEVEVQKEQVKRLTEKLAASEQKAQILAPTQSQET